MLKISQSLINDLTDANMCPKHIKFKYYEGKERIQSDAMFAGNYFEFHVLGDTRDHNFPVFENVDRKNLKPTKSRSIKSKVEYLQSKGVEFDKGADLDSILDVLPEDLSEGRPCKAQIDLNELVLYAINILFLMGIDPAKGETQVRIETDTLLGHLDHVNVDFQAPERKAIYDLKYTETKETDRWNGWTDFMLNINAQVQAKHYIKLYHEKHGVYLPFYFLVFGKSKWAKIFKIDITEEGMSSHEYTINSCAEQLAELEKANFPASPRFNKCAKCDFYEICEQKKLTPEVEEITI